MWRPHVLYRPIYRVVGSCWIPVGLAKVRRRVRSRTLSGLLTMLIIWHNLGRLRLVLMNNVVNLMFVRIWLAIRPGTLPRCVVGR